MKLKPKKNNSQQTKGSKKTDVLNQELFSSEEFEKTFNYDGDDLGAVWSEDKTIFKVWAPTASNVQLNLYKTGDEENLIESIPMTKKPQGIWSLVMLGNLSGTYYTYSVTVNDITKEAVDPYAKAVGVNGNRGMVVDLNATDPEGFLEDTKPAFRNATDAIIYELHIRDFSSDDSSGMVHKGKYLAFTETGTTSPSGEKTGIDYLVDLGITHVHLLPSFDFYTIDESKPKSSDFNWGYDPYNFNVPEGSYSTDPWHGEVRIKEYKQMVQALHSNGIRVIMDVVYNHTALNSDSNFNTIVPNYYYRMNNDGSFSDASDCGNETASERAMMRKFIVDSVAYWATEYHVDGFRFDLMGIHDLGLMNAVREALDHIDSSILVYGEGWAGGSSVLPEKDRALKINMPLLDSSIAAFSDDVRDGLKGNVFDSLDTGFVNGKSDMEETVKFGVVASTKHSHLDYSKVIYSDTFWAKEPTQTVNYTSAHDNLTLWDKLAMANPNDSKKDRIKMNLLAGTIVLTSQGIPFFLAGEEILRSKPLDDTGSNFDENSYKSPDSVNSIKWELVKTNKEIYQYYKGLIAFRKLHGALRMTKTEDIQASLTFLEGLEDNVVGYTIDPSPNRETIKALCIIYNANKTSTTVKIPEGTWDVYIKGNQAGTKIIETIRGDSVPVAPISAMVLVQH